VKPVGLVIRDDSKYFQEPDFDQSKHLRAFPGWALPGKVESG